MFKKLAPAIWKFSCESRCWKKGSWKRAGKNSLMWCPSWKKHSEWPCHSGGFLDRHFLPTPLKQRQSCNWFQMTSVVTSCDCRLSHDFTNSRQWTKISFVWFWLNMYFLENLKSLSVNILFLFHVYFIFVRRAYYCCKTCGPIMFSAISSLGLGTFQFGWAIWALLRYWLVRHSPIVQCN